MKNLQGYEKSSREEWEHGISHMFCEIAETYEKINTFISMGMDTGWRKRLLSSLKGKLPDPLILDVGCGPGSLSRMAKTELPEAQFISSDISEGMLEVAARSGNADQIVRASASALPFTSETFGAVTSAFVLRNLPDLDLFYSECFRILKPGGQIAMLDLTKPTIPGVSLGHALYMKAALPLGAKIYGSRLEAYEYLDRSIHNCLPPEEMCNKLEQAGLKAEKPIRMCLGTVTLYIASKPL